jgi:hypothetical protein
MSKIKSRKRPGTSPTLLWNIPQDLKRNFKAACARKGEDMTEAVKKMMVDYVKSGDKVA